MPVTTIARQMLYMLGSQGVARVLGFITTMALTRYLGVTGYGQLTLAYAYWGIFALMVEAGLDMTLIREASQPGVSLRRYVGNAILLRLAITGGCYLLAQGLLLFLQYEPATTDVIRGSLLMLFASPLTVMRLTFFVRQRIERVAILDGIAHVLTSSALICGMLLSVDVLTIIWLQVGATILAQGFYIYYGMPLLEPAYYSKPEWSLWSSLLVQAGPLLVVTLLGQSQIHLTRLLIGSYLGTVQTGLYAIATNLVLTAQLLPPIYFASVYPLFVRHASIDPLMFQQLYRLSFRLLMIIALPLAVLMSLTSADIVTAYAGDAYADAAPLLTVMAWGIVLNFAGVVLYHILLATRQQGLLPRVLGSAVGLQVLLLVILLPMLGTMGAVIAHLSLYIISLTIYGILPQTKGYIFEWFQVSARPAIGALLLGVLFLLMQPPVLVTWFAGLSLYGVYATLVILTPAEHQAIWNIVRSSKENKAESHAGKHL